MKMIEAFLGGDKPNKDSIKDTKLGNRIEKLANDISIEIVRSYKDKLIHGPITYIVPAVWGFGENGEIDRDQLKMHQQILPVIKEISEMLQLEKMEQTQAFAIEIIIRGLVITKILYMIECYKNLKNRHESGIRNQGMNLLENAEPIGSV